MTKDLIKFANYSVKILQETFPNADIELDYDKNDPWQLLVVVSLSAQSTDKKVNEISPDLFKRFPQIDDFAHASEEEIAFYIKKLGLYRNKAKNLKAAAIKIIQQFNKNVPNTRELLETLPGVGKKTSAVIVANAFNTPAIAVDTHVARISYRLGLSKNTNPDKIEQDLCSLLPDYLWFIAHHTFILHGRRICLARKPQCSVCPLDKHCPKIGIIKK